MNTSGMKHLLLDLFEKLRLGSVSPQEALDILKFLPFEDIHIARIDTSRELRQGFPELIYGKDKTLKDIQEIVSAMLKMPIPIIVTKLSGLKAKRLLKDFPEAQYFPEAKLLRFNTPYDHNDPLGPVGLIAAGTADLPVLEEARLILETLGVTTKKLVDVGVAGIHRIMPEMEGLKSCRVLIVFAGMEGALPSLIGGLFGAPVLAVPTSCGYGSHLGGLTPLMAMLTSCSNLAVFNVDNGAGAALFALRILKTQERLP